MQKLLIFILFVSFLAGCASVQDQHVATGSHQEPEKTPAFQPTRLKEGGIFVPKTMEEAYRELDQGLSEKTKAFLLKEEHALSPEEQLNRSYFVNDQLGMWMRNNWQLWDGGDLAYALSQQGIYHADDISSIIIDSYIARLRGETYPMDVIISKKRQYYQNRLQLVPALETRGMRWLISMQNPDGSWGKGSQRLYLTLVASWAFISYGHAAKSTDYGPSLEKTYAWLSAQTPESPIETALQLHVFTATAQFDKDPVYAEQAKRLADLTRTLPQQGVSQVLVALIHSPGETNASSKQARALLKRLINHPDPHEPAQLIHYLQSLARFMDNKDGWKQDYITTIFPHVQKQQRSGAFLSETGEPCIETTAFTLMQMSVYYRYWLDYMSIGHP